MNNNLNTNYLFKALDAYPYDLAETIESLNYALAYDENDVEALYLMAMVYGYQLMDYPKAIAYCEEALSKQMDFPKIYPLYAHVLICNEEHDKAQKALDFGMTINGSDKASLMRYQALLYERLSAYKKAIKAFEEAKKTALNNDFISLINNEISRVKNKIKPKKKKKKGKSEKKARK